jgi:type IV pilus assembly protein PilQ
MNKQTWAFKARADLPRLLGRVVRHALLGVVMLAGAVPLLAMAENSIKAVSGSVQGKSEIIRVDMVEPLATAPTGFSIQAPARIALDFQGVGTSLTRSAIDLSLGNVRSANLIQAGGRTRLVLNLKIPATYKTEIQDKSLLIILDTQAAAAPSAMVSPVFAESRSRNTLPLKDIDFRRGADSSGRIVVALPNNEVGVDIRQQGKTLVVEFMKTTLPEGLRRRLDVADFGTPVQTVTTFQTGDKVRMVIEPSGDWDHSAYQRDNQFVLEIRRQKIDANKLSRGIGYSGEKLSLNFQNIEIRSLLQVIADFTNFNVVTSDTVTGSVTLRLKDVPWDQALDIILQAKGLDRRKTGNVLLIAPKDELAAKDKLEMESRNTLQGLEGVRTQSFQINYAKASDIAAQISGGGSGASGGAGGAGEGNARLLSHRGSLIAEPRTNQLFVTDIPSRLEQVQDFITKLDIPVRQVLIEARIVEASDTFGRSLGVKLGGGQAGTAGALTAGNTNVAVGSYSGTAGTTNFVNLPASTLGVANAAAAFAVSIFNAGANRFLNLELSALEADGKGKIVSSPRVVTADQTKALIEQGTEYPYQTATSSGATSLAFRKANLKMEVTPHITPEGNIILDLDVNKDSRGETTAAGIAINTKHVTTQVLVENGGTVVIGGIFTLEETEDEIKVPLLGDVPYLGNLFKSRERSSKKQEMLVFITPKMISDRTAGR